MNDEQNHEVEKRIREKILHVLEVFPFISASMLNMGIGTSSLSILWRPILDSLIEEGKVQETNHTCKSPTGRQQSYTIYHLATNAYTNQKPDPTF